MVTVKTGLIFTTLFIASCGGSGGGGSSDVSGTIPETAPSVDIGLSNMQNLAVAVTEGASQAASGEDLPTGFPTGSNGSVLNSAASSNARMIQNINCSDVGLGNGSIVFNLSDNNSSFSTIYNCDSINGSISASYIPSLDNWSSFSVVYNDLIADGITTNGSINCTRPTTNDFAISCTYGFNDIAGLDGRTYTVANVTVDGNNSSGYTIMATVTDPDAGAVDFSATNLTFSDCEYGVPSSGTITVMGTNNTRITVTYNDCGSMTVTDESGATTVYTWADLASI